MKKASLLIFVYFCTLNIISAQNIFNPMDTVKNYSSSNPPAQPAPGIMAKWYRTSNMNWNTSQFKCYIYNGMAFRLRFPNNYDATKKYPVIVFMHGGGEIGPISDNENQLLWGAERFQDSLNDGKFNAFMLFPQVSNYGWGYSHYENINSIIDTLKKYNGADEDRVISMGLSNGGFAALAYSIYFPRRSSVAIAASPALLSVFTDNDKLYFTHIPLFISSGDKDTNPERGDVKRFVDSFAAKGGDVRWVSYPDLGHLTWEQLWSEGRLVNYWQKAHKANPLIYFTQNVFCADSLPTMKIGITSGYPQYQWQKDGVDMSGETGNEVSVSSFGTYRVRFRRIDGGDWSAWSPNPAVIAARPATQTPDIMVTGLKSKVLPAPDGSTFVPLELPAGYNSYEWRKVSDNSLLSLNRTFNATAGQYKALIAGCNRTYSTVFTVGDANVSPKPDAAISLTATRVSDVRTNLSWSLARVTQINPVSYEIYQTAVSGGKLSLVAIVSADSKTFSFDAPSADTTSYYYRVRAVNETAAASLSNEALATESIAPSVPGGLKVVSKGKTFVYLDWSNATDNVGIAGYDVFVGGVKKYSCRESSITADNLNPNSTYLFTVRSRDLSGNTSGQGLPVTAVTANTADGLRYRYYEGNWDSLPDFNDLTAVKAATSASPDLSVKAVSDHFGIVWEGYLNVPAAGTYTFELASDDGSKFYLDKFYMPASTPFLNNDGTHGDNVSVAKSINLTSGLHPIALTYFQGTGSSTLKLYWTGPNLVRQIIPASAFAETAALIVIPGLGGLLPLGTAASEETHRGIDQQETAAEMIITSSRAYPNPFGESINIQLNNQSRNHIIINAYDLAGRLMLTKDFGILAAGLKHLTINTDGVNMKKGNYLIELNVNGKGSGVWQMVKLKR